MKFSELLQNSWKVYKHESRSIILTSAIIYVITTTLLLLYVMHLMISSLQSDQTKELNIQSEWDSLSIAIKVGFFVILIIYKFVSYGLVSAGVARIVTDSQGGRKVKGGSIAKSILRFLPLGTPVCFILGTFILIGGIFCIVGGLFVAPFISFIAPAIVIEEGSFNSIAKGFRTATRDYWMVVSSWLLLGISYLAIAFVLFVIPFATQIEGLMQIASLALLVLIGQTEAFHGCLMTVFYSKEMNQRLYSLANSSSSQTGLKN